MLHFIRITPLYSAKGGVHNDVLLLGLLIR